MDSLPLIFFLAIGGAVVDWRYKRRGGKRPTKVAKTFLLLAVLACATGLSVIATQGADPAALGRSSVDVMTMILGVWELVRWRIRQKNPAPTPSPN